MFEQLLTESLESEFPSGVTPKDFLRFLTAIVTSTSIEKIPQALERAAALPTAELIKVIGQVQYNGDVMGLRNAVANKPQYSVDMLELAKRVLPETDLPGVVNSMSGSGDIQSEDYSLRADGVCSQCGEGQLIRDEEDGVSQCDNCGANTDYCESCDKWSQGDPSFETKYWWGTSNYCSSCSHQEEYNQDADYYSKRQRF
mgnify:CR=1 FL=1|tara:strand:+ start:2158 stop:2757 length:600 start_codon:yes stop_codon:yes gene_type:complete